MERRSGSRSRIREEEEEEEEGPLTQIEGDTFRVAGDGRWWKERRADGKKKKTKSLATCLSSMQGSRRALERSAVGGLGFPMGNIAFF